MILACDERYKKLFPNVPFIGFKSNKNLVRSQLSDLLEQVQTTWRKETLSFM